ncbi:A disintegrin and metalloproteinase with thrombospondin motifs adt-1 [Anopheles arabiensis]|uniref:A disintegrin and metalloproteinase with thrombospondin motifs adt-1 n=1 Tax=Anopheles arabiensis TaxID=7173 RepID=UPI001AAD7988|nr:A disintegrin and metalloproteinase with thrombospondin motifs adt-1 [Anopheles arabiensis]
MPRPQLQPFFTAVGSVMLQIVALLALILIAARNPTVRCLHMEVERVNHLVLDNAKIDERNLHNFLEEHEQLLLFGDRTTDDFKLVNVRQRKRESRSTPGSGFLQFNLSDGREDNFALRLQKSDILIDESFAFIESYDNSTQLLDDSYDRVLKYRDCFYRNERAAFDLCEGSVRGLIRTNESEIVIHPLPERFGTGAHVILNRNKTRTSDESGETKVMFEPDMNEPTRRRPTVPFYGQSQQSRLKRHISSNHNAKVPDVLHIETAIFIDKDLYRHMSKNYPKNTEAHLIRFVLAMINGVQLLYNHPSLGHPINFILKRLEILHNDPKDLRRSSDIDIYLNSFCGWQRKMNPISDADPVHFDHAVILTGLDLFVVSKNGKVSNQVVGLAPVAGMCTITSSCTINEGKHFESVFVVSHEIGHNLGMRHDTSENNCDPSLYIMSPTLGSGKITWSSCSRNYLNTFLKTSQATCLFDRGHYGSSLDHTGEGRLPGERFDADQQCLLKYGKDSTRSKSQDLADICRDLHCQRDRYTWTSHPALEGTNCGKLMWCRSGVCVSKIPGLTIQSTGKHITAFKTIDKKTFLEGLKFASLRQDISRTLNTIPTWDSWSEPTECVSGCLYGESGRLKEGSTGLRQFTRKCLDKRKNCSGFSRKYETCIAKQCYNIGRTTILEFSNQICGRAKEFDPDIIGYGLQKVAEDPEDSCKVFCETKAGVPKTKSWIYPDGTACKVQNGDFDDAYYCVSGRCEKFSCNNTSNNYYRMDGALCTEVYQYTERSGNSIHQENVRDYKSLPLNKNAYPIDRRAESSTIRTALRNYTARKPPPDTEGYSSQAENTFNRWRERSSSELNRLSELQGRKHNWEVKSGCHFSCMERGKGVQIVSSTAGTNTNIQLCTANTIACDKVLSTYEFATQLCKRYQQKVSGLSGIGMQIAPSIEDPDRSCRVACQDTFIRHRFYLVNGEQGHFPFGTRCNHNESNRYCINGKCLHFGSDDIPVNESYNALPNVRIKRSTNRTKRHFEYFAQINVTERLSQEFLENLIANIDFGRTTNENNIVLEEHIDLKNPIYVDP